MLHVAISSRRIKLRLGVAIELTDVERPLGCGLWSCLYSVDLV